MFVFLYDMNAAATLGIEPPPLYLSLSQNDDAILQGVNFASGGAGTLNETGFFVVTLSFSSPTLKILVFLGWLKYHFDLLILNSLLFLGSTASKALIR